MASKVDISKKDTATADKCEPSKALAEVAEQDLPLTSTPKDNNKQAKSGFFHRLKKDAAKESPKSAKRKKDDLSKSNNEDTQEFLAMTSKELDELIERRVSEKTEDLTMQLTGTIDSLRGHDFEIVEVKRENEYLRNRFELQQGRITRLEKVVEDQREEILMIQARSMRDNVIFYNVPEKGRETYEETKKVVQDFLKEEMRMTDENIKKVEINRAHRSGFNPRGPRNIIANMKTSESKFVIMSHAKNLNRGKNFGVSEQLPREMNERKKQLLPKFRSAQQQEKKPKWNLDKLVIDRKETKVEKDKIRDININTENVALNLIHTKCPPKEYSGSAFQGHKVQVTSQDDIIPALHRIYSDSRVARATHNIYAYRLKGVGGKVMEHFEDDQEWGAGRRLLKLLQDSDTMNTVVCVTRWCGKKLLGPDRFRYTEEAGTQVLAKPWPEVDEDRYKYDTTYF